MEHQDLELLFEMLGTASPTGFEMPGQRVWAKGIQPFADSVETDAYGNTWARRSGVQGAPCVMVEAHADEIGFIVKHITSSGYLHVDRVGGSDVAISRGRRVNLLGDQGVVRGIIGATAIHLRENRGDEKVPKTHEIFVDVGATSAEEVKALGLRVGHPAVYADGAELFGKNRLVGRALDNRVSGFILRQVFKRLSEMETPHDANLIMLNAVQEEIGGYGARMATSRLKPDVAIVLDVTHATDTPTISVGQHGEVNLGEGPTVTHGTANHPLVVQRILDTATRLNIPIQHEASSRYTGTDTDSIYDVAGGIPSALISLPLRYMHTVVETCDLGDLEKTIELVTGFLLSIKVGDDFHQRL